MKVQKLVQHACQAIVDKKGCNIVALDVRGVSTICDYFIIAEGGVSRHVTALARHIDEQMSKFNMYPIHVEGLEEGEWVVMDYMDFIVHLFTPEFRHYYALEEVWKEGKILPVEVNYGPVCQKSSASLP